MTVNGFLPYLEDMAILTTYINLVGRRRNGTLYDVSDNLGDGFQTFLGT